MIHIVKQPLNGKFKKTYLNSNTNINSIPTDKNDSVLSTIQLNTKLTSDTSRTQYHSAGTKGVDLLARQNP